MPFCGVRWFFALACLTLVFSFRVHAAESAILVGKVTDSRTGAPVAGGTIQIQGRSAAIDTAGNFSLSDLTPGHYVLTILVPNHDRRDVAVDLAAATTTLPPIVLSSEPIQVLEKFVVEGKTEGAGAKFENKAGADTLTEVVSERDLKNPTAQSGSDLLKNTSGVTVSAGAGGTSNVSVRGIDQRMLRITVDGQRQGGTGNALDSIPPEIVQSLEVTKTFTPDMEADAVGGVININTGGTVIKTGYAQGRQQLTFNTLEPRLGTRSSLTVARPFSLSSSKPNASVMVTASFEDQYKVRERVSALREWTPQISPGPTPYLGQELPVLTQPLIESTTEHRQRTGLVANADARFGDTAVFFRGNFGRDWAKRNRDYDDTDPASGILQSLTPSSGVFSGVRQSRRNQRQISQRDAANFSTGGKTRIGKIDIDGTASYSLTREGEPRTLEDVFLSEHTYRVAYDLAPNPYAPVYTFTDETVSGDTTSARDPAHYLFNYLTLTKIDTKDTEGILKLNAKINLDDAAKSGDYLKFGGKAQQRHRTSEIEREVFGPGLQPRNMVGLVGSPWVEMGTVDYRFGPVADSSAVTNLLTTDPSAFRENVTQTEVNSGSGDYRITETVWAIYGMGRVKLKQWTVLSGVRVEGTRVSSTANQMVFDSTGSFQGFTPARGRSNYTEILPGLHLRYDPTPGLLYRGSITRSLSRPAYADIAPFRTISFVDRRSRIGSPELKPYQSTNFDLSVDKYSEAYGLISASVFYKKIDHFITDAQYPVRIGNLGQFIEFKRVNGETASALGFEASWQSATRNLPANLGRGSLELNYSFNHGRAHHPGRPGETFPLPRQVDHQVGIRFHDERGPLSLDISLRYRTGWWEDMIAAGLDNFITDQWDGEISANYKVGKNTRISAGASNLFNAPTRHYAGIPSRMNDSQLNGIDFTLGVQWKI